MFCICHCVSHHILQKHSQHGSNLFINKTRYSLDSSPPSEPSDSWLGDALDIVSQHLSMPLSSSFSQSFSPFSSPFLHI